MTYETIRRLIVAKVLSSSENHLEQMRNGLNSIKCSSCHVGHQCCVQAAWEILGGVHRMTQHQALTGTLVDCFGSGAEGFAAGAGHKHGGRARLAAD